LSELGHRIAESAPPVPPELFEHLEGKPQPIFEGLHYLMIDARASVL